MALLSTQVEVIPKGKMIPYYKNKGYVVFYNTPLLVKIDDLSKNSHVYVLVKCDCCGKEQEIAYREYLQSLNCYGFYSCKHCNYIKQTQTVKLKYDVDNYSKTEEFLTKIKNISQEKYGTDYFTQASEVRQKINNTLCKNGNQNTSKQQLYLHSIYGGELNYPIKHYASDICFPKEKLVIEYDGGGHDLNVKLGRLSINQFNQKEIIRNKTLKSEGYKQIKIISSKDLLPSEEILLQMLEQAKEYFSTTKHTWYEYDIDTSTVRNAEHKDGVFFNYGELRKIKKIA